MQPSSKRADANLSGLLAYVADLEVEVDRLRRHNRHLHEAVRRALIDVRRRCTSAEPALVNDILTETGAAIEQLMGMLRDLQEHPGYHPAHDQVIAIAVRPLAEQIFRWHQWQAAGRDVTLQLNLESDYVEWFPARLRNILDNLLSNALKYRDRAKVEAWVRLELRVTPSAYEFRVTDNGVGLEDAARDRAFDLLSRAGPMHTAGLGVGLAVAKRLVEQSGGTLITDAGQGQGTTIRVVLPRFELEDFLL
jgi:signal transduction histidine kinase